MGDSNKISIGEAFIKIAISLDIIEEQKERNNIQLLSIELRHILALENLPFHHRDPFDRLLIAQLFEEAAQFVSCDSIFSRYSVKVEW